MDIPIASTQFHHAQLKELQRLVPQIMWGSPAMTSLANIEFGKANIPLAGGGGSGVWGAITGTLSNQTDLQSALNAKQATLVSATNIKTVNGSSLLGSGDLSISSTAAWGSITGTLASQSDLQSALNAKQATLVSATNIKTVNGTSLLGSGDLVISGTAAWGAITGTLSAQTDLQSALNAKQATLVSATNIKTVNGTSLLGSGDVAISGTAAWGSITGTLASQADLVTALGLKLNVAGPTWTGLATHAGAETLTATAMGANVIDITAARNTKTYAATTSVTFSAALSDGIIFGCDWNITTACVITFPANFVDDQSKQVRTAVYFPVGRWIFYIKVNGTTAYGVGLPQAVSNFAGTAPPTVSNDNTQGYGVGSTWLDITNSVNYVALSVATGAAVWLQLGSAGVSQNSKSANYTTTILDANKHIYHPLADTNNRTFTIDSNANVPYPIGTTLTFVNDVNTVTIAITADTMVLAGAGSTGSRTLAANGIATAIKLAATRWMINGTGLT